MNVVVGILIGVVNDSWAVIVLASFLWGLVWCVYQSIHKSKFEGYRARIKDRNLLLKWGMSYAQSFYFIEYSTASITALTFSILTKFVKAFLPL